MSNPDDTYKNKHKASKFVRLINPQQLTVHQRQTVWKGIKTANPALADALKNDPNIAKLKELFGANIVFTAEEINDYTKVGMNSGKQDD